MQTEINFPAPKEPTSPQLTIPATETVIGLRYHFQVPVYGGKKGNMLTGYKHVVHVYANLADDEVMTEYFDNDVNKLAQEYMKSATRRMVKREGLPNDDFVTFKGIDVCHHLACTKPADNDSRWV